MYSLLQLLSKQGQVLYIEGIVILASDEENFFTLGYYY